jgi:hypothetical protein
LCEQWLLVYSRKWQNFVSFVLLALAPIRLFFELLLRLCAQQEAYIGGFSRKKPNGRIKFPVCRDLKNSADGAILCVHLAFTPEATNIRLPCYSSR